MAELPEGDDYPVGNVNFAEAEAFCHYQTPLPAWQLLTERVCSAGRAQLRLPWPNLPFSSDSASSQS
jgi:hypothetical protein